MNNLRSHWDSWYERHSSDKDEVGFTLAMIFFGILVFIVIIIGASLLADAYPIIGVGVSVLIGAGLLGLWLHYIFSIKDPSYKKQKDPYNKSDRV